MTPIISLIILRRKIIITDICELKEYLVLEYITIKNVITNDMGESDRKSLESIDNIPKAPNSWFNQIIKRNILLRFFNEI